MGETLLYFLCGGSIGSTERVRSTFDAVKILKQEGKIFEVCIFGTGPEEK